MKLHKLKLLFICLSLGLGHHVFAQTPDAAKDEKVGDSALAIDTSKGTVAVHQSLNDESRFYIAPNFKFLAVNTNGDVARLGATSADKTDVIMKIQLVAPTVRREVADKLDVKKIWKMGNLPVNAIRVDLKSDFLAEKYGIENGYKIDSPAYAQDLNVVFSVASGKADEFIREVNSGKVTFRLTYAFNQINIDSYYEELSARFIRDTHQLRSLDQQGKELMTTEQMAEAAKSIRREIISKHITSLGGKIEPRSIPLEKLMVLFEVGDLMKKTEAELADFEKRLYKQLNLNVDPKDFQPFRVQKHVIESLNSSKDVAEQRQNYSRDYNREKKKFSVSVSASAKWGPFSGSVSSHYAKEAEKVTDRRAMSDEAFREFVAKSHGVEYDTEERLFRGVKIYDTQKIKALGDLKVVSVTVKPTLTSGVKRLDLVPKSPIYGELTHGCPAGMDNAGGYCIHTISPYPRGKNWWQALDACIADGYRLCSQSEVVNALKAGILKQYYYSYEGNSWYHTTSQAETSPGASKENQVCYVQGNIDEPTHPQYTIQCSHDKSWTAEWRLTVCCY